MSSSLRPRLCGSLGYIVLTACATASRESAPTTLPVGTSPATATLPTPSAPPAAVAAAPPAAEPQLEPDGNDEVPEPAIALPEHGHFEKVGRHWAALQRVCD